MKKALLLAVLLLLVGFVSHAWGCVEFDCVDPALASSLVCQFGGNLWEALL